MPKAIGGWLILVALGVILGPFRIGHLLVTTFPPIFSDGTWEAITTETSEVYSALWAPFILGEIAFNLILLVASIYMAILFFSKKSNFPKWFAALSIVSAIFILLDAYVASIVMPGIPMFDSETSKEFGRSLVSCLIWTPYLFLSQRSKETFIR